MTAKRQLRKRYTHIDYISAVYTNSSNMFPPLSWPGTSTLHASAKAKPSLGTECIQAPQVTSSFLIKKKKQGPYTFPLLFLLNDVSSVLYVHVLMHLF